MLLIQRSLVCLLIVFCSSHLLFSIQPSNGSFSDEQTSILPLPHDSFDPYDWDVSTPEEQGIDSKKLALAYQVAETKPFLYSLLVIRNGYLVAEQYYHVGGDNTAFTVHSVSKSFTSALVGIAFREGYLTSLDQKLLDFFPEYITPELDPRKHNITLKHLLTMTAGLYFVDTPEYWESYWTSSDWVKYAIELPLSHDPGTDWQYSTLQTNLLSTILTRATNMSTRTFAEQYLLNPLQISVRYWHQDPQGYYTGGHEMHYTPRDMARFGQLYLNNGSIEGEQIVPINWIEESLQDYSMGALERYGVGYGYKWWLERISGYETYSARGLGGQYILNIPELNITVVTTASGSIYEMYPNQSGSILDIIRNYVLPAVVSSEPLDTSTEVSGPGFDVLFMLIGLFTLYRNRKATGLKSG